MQNQQFFPDEFITANVLNAQVNTNINNFQSLLLGRGLPGLISPTSVSYSISGLALTVTAPLPFQVLFGTGILASAHGTLNGADTQSYTASFSGVVPGAGFPAVTAYLVATYQQIQQNPVIFIGPPPGHPDFNPNYTPYTAFTQLTDSVNIFATVAPPDNSTSFELFRCTLTSGATGLGTISTAYQEWASSLSDMPIQEWAAPGTLMPQTMNNILVGGTYTMPNANTYNSNLLSITCNTASLVTITSPNNIYGYYGQGAAGLTTIILAQGGSIDFEAINGGWQIIGGNALGLGVPVNVFPWTVPQGGTGQVTFPAHTVLLGEGTSAIGNVGPGTPGLALIGQGSSADPVFGAINLNSGAVTNILQVGNGGSGNNSYNSWGTLIYNGNTGTFTTVAPGGVGVPLVANGGSSPPSYQALNLAGGPVSVAGVLPIGFGGTNTTSFTSFGTIAMNSNTGALIGIGPNVAGTALISNGGSTLPSYQAVNLGNGNAVTSILQIGNGGTGESAFTPWSTIVMDNFINTLAGVGPGAAGAPLVSNGATLPAYQQLNLGNSNAITGTLPIAHGGTGNTSFIAYGTLVMDNSAALIDAVFPGSAGEVLTSNGTGASPTYQPIPALPNPQWLTLDQGYFSSGTYAYTVPSWAGYCRVHCWGAGGGGSGSNPSGGVTAIGASGGGGGYSYGTYGVTPGGIITITVGGGGAGANNGNQAGNGGDSSASGAGVSIVAGGGIGGSAGPGLGGSGSGGAIAFNGEAGEDLDGLIGSGGSNMFARGGSAGGGGGKGGHLNAAGVVQNSTGPGGGGGANYYVSAGSNGADGGVLLIFMSSTMTV